MAIDTISQRSESLPDLLRSAAKGNIGVPILLMVLMGMMILPVPSIILDVLFSFNIALSIVVLLVAVYTLRPLDFAVFPSVLLITTLLRLSLNVASTRVVLLQGHEGGDAAGKVIQAFGEVVVGGNYAVGMVVFMILIIINFVVVTKGAGRISEVSARFTLDAMPGKQMAIDADLNAGIIDQEESRIRREDVSSEADFYGSMDGASKFVRGDAIAGLLILAINIIGGLLIGMVQHELAFSDALRIYTLLTIGDGLVAQIPSLLLSTSAALMVTRVNSSQDMGEQVTQQLLGSPRAVAVAAMILGLMGSIPGMPHVAFLGLAAVCAGLAFSIARKNKELQATGTGLVAGSASALAGQGGTLAAPGEGVIAEKTASEIPELGWDDVQPIDMVGLEVGYRLIPLVDKGQGGELLGRIKGIRKKLSQEIGFLIPSVHIRDNLDLPPNAYRITLKGVTAGEGEVHPDRDLAINPGQVFGKLDGMETKDPAFGLDAVWIDQGEKDHAQTLGYTVVDTSTVVATHMNQLLQRNIHELLGHEEIQHLLDLLAKNSPKLAEELVPDIISINVLLKVLKSLLVEQVPVRDMRTIAESLSACAPKSQDTIYLAESVRESMRRVIVQNICGNVAEIPVMTLDANVEQLLLKSVQQAKQLGNSVDEAVLEPGMVDKLQVAITDAAQKQEMAGKTPVLLVAAPIRPLMAKFVRYSASEIHVLSYNEIPDDKQITIEAVIG